MCQTFVVFLHTPDDVRAISLDGITTRPLDDVTSSFTVDVKETKIDSTLNLNADELAALSSRKACYRHLYVN